MRAGASRHGAGLESDGIRRRMLFGLISSFPFLSARRDRPGVVRICCSRESIVRISGHCVRLAVRRKSAGQQIPWESTSLEEDFYFQPPRQSRKLSEEEREKQGDQFFRQEYCCEFTDSDESLFDSDVILAAITDEVQPLALRRR